MVGEIDVTWMSTAAHEPLVRVFEPITLGGGRFDAEASTRAITEPLAATSVRFDAAVVAEIVELSGGRPYYLQKLAYYAFDASEHGQVSEVQFAVAFEQAFASVSQEIFAARWSAMAPIERRLSYSASYLEITRVPPLGTRAPRTHWT